MKFLKNPLGAALLAGGVFVFGAGVSGSLPFGAFDDLEYDASAVLSRSSATSSPTPTSTSTPTPTSTQTLPPVLPPVSHRKTPENVRAIYMTSWVAATPSIRARLVKLVEETEINTLVIDVKDYTGKIAFKISADENPTLAKIGADENRVRDMREFLAEMHQKGVYVVARIAVFQDPYFVKLHPDLAVKRANGKMWEDRKGAVWIDPGAKEMWNYAVAIAREAFAAGFDEANFDYVRFPSDGNLDDMVFPISQSRSKREVMREFFAFLGGEMKQAGIPSSVDVFGMTTTAQDDMGIGQMLPEALANFDFVAPMIYPSHYPPHFNGMKNPAALPYETVRYAMASGVERAKQASSTPAKFRPWIQDFDLGADYGVKEVQAQIRALAELGIHSWMVWDPSNHYTAAAYQRVPER